MNQKLGKIGYYGTSNTLIKMNTEAQRLELIQWIAGLEDVDILSRMKGFKAETENSIFTQEEAEELEQRLEKSKNGESNFTPLMEAIDQIRKNG